jgi:signal transduction histidine kinase
MTRPDPARTGGVRPVDVVATLLLCAVTTWMVVLMVTSAGWAVRVDSHSWWQLPVFLVATAPVLWWRRHLAAALTVMVGAMALHLLVFGHVVRCGAGLPVAFVVAFMAGYGYDRRRAVPLLGLAAVYSTLLLAWDTAAGPGTIPVALVVQAALWAVGQVAHSRAVLADELRERTRDLQALRDERTALEVSDDRARLCLELETLLDQRLARLEAAATSPDAGADVLVELEDDSRRTLEDMRRVVGVLRGGEVALAPAPSVAHVEGLLARRGSARLTVEGDPRELAPSLELSAYRIVEHLLGLLDDDPDAAVVLGFSAGALEIRVIGRVPRGTDARVPVARARERARLHAGSLDAKVGRGRARVVATLPTAVG